MTRTIFDICDLADCSPGSLLTDDQIVERAAKRNGAVVTVAEIQTARAEWAKVPSFPVRDKHGRPLRIRL